MIHTEDWTANIHIEEQERTTHAVARLHTRDATSLEGHGTARRNPSDRDVPEIGAELAVARALLDLQHRLLEAALLDIEQATGEPAHLTR
ncbi:DUF1876 domain-containing protein [Actinomycetospora cinnamomea]|uniref:Uncharacterized protein DUF1876 n=1 Tax=Actinomycetospora cinnamomea TaxID=663609 RepID=A0A2U1F2C0_9PSEU|nr:DUF1876 domain-containing protein [Actinomycetospora cinnamomea]PVZ06333.1 uncharacterized protein DUF1876 [Actinomycetospora cinnamomea]